MAGTTRTVTVNVVGDATGLNKALGSVSGNAETTGSKLKHSFSSAFSVIGASSGGAFGPLQEVMGSVSPAMDALSDKTAKFGDKMIGVGAGVAGAGMALSMFGSKDQAAQQQLSQAIQNVGGNFADYKDRIDAAIKSNEHFGYTSSETQNALQQLTTATKSPTQALALMSTAANLAADKHEDLSTATQQLIQIIGGKGTKVLASLGIQHVAVANTAKMLASATDGVTKAQTKLTAAQQKLSDLETIDHAKKTLTVADEVALKQAHENVTAAALVLAQAHGKVTMAENAAKDAGAAQANVLKQVAEATKGQASAAADTFSGRLKYLKAAIEDNVASLGQKYGPALTGIGAGMAAVGSVVSAGSAIFEKFSGAGKDAAAATDTVTAASDGAATAQDALAASDGVASVATDAEAAATGLEDVALGVEDVELGVADVAEGIALAPILLIIAAVALLGVGIYELATHWSTVWNACKAVAVDVWHGIDSDFIQPIEGFFSSIPGFIKAHWQLILAILTGPIGLAVLFIKDNFNGIVSFFEGIPSDIGNAISGVVGTITAPFKTAISDVTGAWSAIYNMFWAFPGQMASVAAGMWGWIAGAFRGAINDVIGLWNGLHFTLPSVSFLGAHIGGETIGVPQVPYMAKGGIVNRPTLAMIGEAGPEAVVPLSGANNPLHGGGNGGGHSHDIYLDGQKVGKALAQPVRKALLQSTGRSTGKVGLA